MVLERGKPPDLDPEVQVKRRRWVIAKYPGHTWHVDLTVVPTRAGFWVPWFPFSLPQRWPFCWWVVVVLDQVSRAVMGFAVFPRSPSSDQIQRFLDRAIRECGRSPQYVVTDKGRQFWCRTFKRWCRRHGIRPRYGAVGQPASIALVERFIRSMKDECTRCILVPLWLAAMRRELGSYACWYNTHRPHAALVGGVPDDILRRCTPRTRRFEPRSKWPRGRGRRRRDGDRLRLAVSYVAGRGHLPIIELRRAA